MKGESDMSNAATQASDQKVMGFTVVLDEDISRQEADFIREHIGFLKKVSSIETVDVSAADVINRHRIRSEFSKKLKTLINIES